MISESVSKSLSEPDYIFQPRSGKVTKRFLTDMVNLGKALRSRYSENVPLNEQMIHPKQTDFDLDLMEEVLIRAAFIAECDVYTASLWTFFEESVKNNKALVKDLSIPVFFSRKVLEEAIRLHEAYGCDKVDGQVKAVEVACSKYILK